MMMRVKFYDDDDDGDGVADFPAVFLSYFSFDICSEIQQEVATPYRRL